MEGLIGFVFGVLFILCLLAISPPDTIESQQKIEPTLKLTIENNKGGSQSVDTLYVYKLKQ